MTSWTPKSVSVAFLLIATVQMTACSTVDNTEVQTDDEVTEAPTWGEDCSKVTYTAQVSGTSPGRYYWLGIMTFGGEMLKAGEPVYVPAGVFSYVTLLVSVEASDGIPPGEYPLRVFGSTLLSDVGDVTKREIAAEASVASVPALDEGLCIDCYAVEIRYEAFINCRVTGMVIDLDVPGVCSFGPVEEYGLGDNRGFLGPQSWDVPHSSKTYQRVTLFYCKETDQWVDWTERMSFGYTRKYGPYYIEGSGDPCCPFRFNQPELPEHLCKGKPTNGDMWGNELTVAVEGLNTSTVTVALDMEAFAECNPFYLKYCAIDGHFEIQVRVDRSGGGFQPEYSMTGSHDGYPSHEMYINGESVLLWDFCAQGQDIFDLCPDAEPLCDDDGESIVAIPWTPFD